MPFENRRKFAEGYEVTKNRKVSPTDDIPIGFDCAKVHPKELFEH